MNRIYLAFEDGYEYDDVRRSPPVDVYTDVDDPRWQAFDDFVMDGDGGFETGCDHEGSGDNVVLKMYLPCDPAWVAGFFAAWRRRFGQDLPPWGLWERSSLEEAYA